MCSVCETVCRRTGIDYLLRMKEKSNAEVIRDITDLILHVKKTYPKLYESLAHDPSLVKVSDGSDSYFHDYYEKLSQLVSAHSESM